MMAAAPAAVQVHLLSVHAVHVQTAAAAAAAPGVTEVGIILCFVGINSCGSR